MMLMQSMQANRDLIIYLDYNCFQRGFDDSRQLRIKMEALACGEIFSWAEQDVIKLAWSFMHEDETHLCPLPERKATVWRLADLCKLRIDPHEEIRELARLFQQKSGLSAKDAIHLACANYADIGVFLTCDDRLIKQAHRLNLNMTIVNPIDYIIREVR